MHCNQALQWQHQCQCAARSATTVDAVCLALRQCNMVAAVGEDAPAARAYVQRAVSSHQQAADILLESRLRMCQSHDMHRRPVTFRPGDQVWLSAVGITLDVHRYRQCQKLTPVYYGPYKIVEVISPVSYRLKLPSTLKIHDVFHVQRLKSASDKEFKGRRRRPAPALPDNVYEVEAIMNDRVRYGKTQYLVKWKGYSMDHWTWEPEANLKCPRLLRQYREEQKKDED